LRFLEAAIILNSTSVTVKLPLNGDHDLPKRRGGKKELVTVITCPRIERGNPLGMSPAQIRLEGKGQS
jgi:hypothetical protein